jgi:exodeoxyribonuclease III
MIKLFSWNVNGIRAVQRKNELLPFIEREQPDVLCIQELKGSKDQAVKEGFQLPQDYSEFWYPADKPGYSGTAIFSKLKPLQVVNGFPEDIIKEYGVTGDTFGDPNQEGRVLAAEFDKFWLVTVYTPNAKDDLGRLALRHKQWDPAFLAYCKQLEQGTATLGATLDGTPSKPSSAKPVVFCGDLNVAHTEDDLANPKPNVGKKGFTNEERQGFQNFVDAGFIDTLRMFKQGNGFYTWWSHFAKSRERNVGWRIDYFMVSKALRSKVKAADIHPAQLGSDHCPISVTLDI